MKYLLPPMLEGLLWGTALVHASGLWGGIIRWTKGPEFARRRSETEQVAFGLAARGDEH